MSKSKRIYISFLSITLIVFIISIINAQYESFFWSNKLLLLVSVFYCAGNIIAIANNKYFFTARSICLMLAIHLYIIFFLISSLFATVNPDKNYKYFFFECIAIVSATAFWVMQWEKNSIKISILNIIKENKAVLLICAAFIFIGIWGTRDVQLWDSLEYESAISKLKIFDYTTFTFRRFYLCGHLSLAYSFLVAPGEFLAPINGCGARIIQIIIGCVTICACQGIIKHYVKFKSTFQNLVLLSIPAFVPAFLGLINYLSIDFALMCFFIWLYYAHITCNYALEILTGFFVCFSKEPGIILYLCFYGCVFLAQLIKTYNIKKTFKTLWISIPAIISWICIFLNLTPWGDGDTSASSTTLELNIQYIVNKCFSLFFINLTWILLLVILFLICRYKKHIITKIDNKFFIFIGSVFLFFVANLFLSTYVHVRYNQIFYLSIALTLSIIIGLEWNKISCILALIISGALLLSNFLTIDPLSYLVFPAWNQENMVSTRVESDTKAYLYSDSVVYNFQYTYFTRAFINFLEKIDYDGTQLILLPDVAEASDISSYCIMGAFSPFVYQKDIHSYRTIMDYNNIVLDGTDNEIPLNILFISEQEDDICLEKYSAVYFWNQNFGYDFSTEKFWEKYPPISEFQERYMTFFCDVIQIK